MRIDAYTQIQQMYGTQNTKKADAPKTGTSFKDQLQLSSAGKDLQTAQSAVAGSSDIRTDLVNSIKEQIDDGTYDVDVDDFAGKMFDKFNGLF